MNKYKYVVLDLVYTIDEGQECFEGTYEDCENFVNQQGSATFMYKIIRDDK